MFRPCGRMCGASLRPAVWRATQKVWEPWKAEAPDTGVIRTPIYIYIERERERCVIIQIHIHANCVRVCICIYIYIYICETERERERERGREGGREGGRQAGRERSDPLEMYLDGPPNLEFMCVHLVHLALVYKRFRV